MPLNSIYNKLLDKGESELQWVTLLLIQYTYNYVCKKFYFTGPRGQIYKALIFFKTYKWAQKVWVFVSGKPFQPGLL
jgi:hypothetical protein